ncbi:MULTISPECIES: iron chelate uptake ABC transporter family permease subunit [unclassified Devosia]|uniref:FecCD family ABC transporter permease n=1 Tax=unclassified Devosia TaxID=196773 RepID=UPI00086E8652|nr:MULTISPECIES: iron chelate uptake ABC transporter family permease subunit [unclassified Devosia]MBN9359932.1 iron chelate uptake ABC transporter family permease subunit [Devosia sp.]ODS94504.1 MAG: iron ABC transporter permease [Devosia sp. SCN 66-27]OJX22007.1 MAG: iron ABC transporter permease [Devosia sp. 66-14]
MAARAASATGLAPAARAGGFVLLALALCLVLVLSITVGARPIALADIWNALTAFDPTQTNHKIILDLRLPRTLVGLLVGAALGLSGAILQGATRNPLADPGILGINAGATLCVVLGISVFGITQLSGYVWLAFLGAGVAMLVVYLVASLGREGATPVKLALAGAAVTAALTSVTSAILITNVETLDQIRFWQVGALTGRTTDILLQVAPFILAGIVLALLTSRILDGLALGDDVARGLGLKVQRGRAMVGFAAVILAGAATAAAGPIAFVGLTVPHLARAFTGPNYRWILPYSMLLAPILLLGADIIGRIIVPPGELQVGIVTAALGAPFFIALVRRRKLAEL